jgi:WD40 repeat protein
MPNGAPASALAWTRTARGVQALLVVGAEEGGGIKVWEARGKVMAAEHAAPDGLPHVLALATSPDGAAFAAALADAPRARAALQLWSLRAGKLVRSIEAGAADSSGSKDGSAAVLAVHHNHNGSLLAGACADGSVRVWDVRCASDRPIMAWRAHAGRPATAVRFSPDETALFSAGAGAPPAPPCHPAPPRHPAPPAARGT